MNWWNSVTAATATTFEPLHQWQRLRQKFICRLDFTNKSNQQATITTNTTTTKNKKKNQFNVFTKKVAGIKKKIL